MHVHEVLPSFVISLQLSYGRGLILSRPFFLYEKLTGFYD